ncbi:hypothetical protein DNO_0453 [Dichelobacter nodosus VCS1703A]|uniref:Uncharacterized protein n=1 Tax=Dichelobacter nodosus (strain VCS1703A) TaxID=246195 RepID=A5EVS8_DICNV|nr:hypothetical protein DNO_0453 [Dichelobacter nodosus VCS1703A]
MITENNATGSVRVLFFANDARQIACAVSQNCLGYKIALIIEGNSNEISFYGDFIFAFRRIIKRFFKRGNAAPRD